MKKAVLIISSAIVLACLLTACGQKPTTGTGAIPASDTTKKYTLAMVANKKDPSCGMPLTAGIGDTAFYKGKAYGFCSKECKNEFLKNPDGYLAKLK